MRETFWPTVGMVDPALGGSGPLGRYSDFTFSRSVYAGERGCICAEEGEREIGGEDERFSRRCRGPADLMEASQR